MVSAPRYVLIALAFFGSVAGGAPVLITDEMIETVRGRVASGREPWAGLWEEMRSAAGRCGRREAKPYTGENSSELRAAALGDARPARDAAVVYRVSGDASALEAARRVLLAWADTRPFPGTTLAWQPYGPDVPEGRRNANAGLNIALTAFQFALVYGLIDETLEVQERERVRVWFSRLYDEIERGRRTWSENGYFGGQHFNNHLSAQLLGQLALAIALQDDERIRYCLSSDENPRDALEMIDGVILMPSRGDDQFVSYDPSKITKPGEVYDRYRVKTIRGGKGFGLGYAMVGLSNLTIVAELAAGIGAMDLWEYVGPHGQCLRVAFEQYANYYTTRDPTAWGAYHGNDRLFMHEVTTYEIAAGRLPESQPVLEVLRVNPGVRLERPNAALGHLPVLMYKHPVPAPEE